MQPLTLIFGVVETLASSPIEYRIVGAAHFCCNTDNMESLYNRPAAVVITDRTLFVARGYQTEFDRQSVAAFCSYGAPTAPAPPLALGRIPQHLLVVKHSTKKSRTGDAIHFDDHTRLAICRAARCDDIRRAACCARLA